jgi:hypothetical protein
MNRARAGLGAMVLAVALSARAEFPTGGGFGLPSSGITAGGGVEMTGGGFRAAATFGGASVTSMKGGGFEVSPGLLVAQRPAQNDLSATHAFPTPFIPSKGHTHITFTRLTAKVTIRVYTLSGELVKTILKDSGASDEVSWFPVVNDQGQTIASGVYLYHVESTDGKTRVGKLMVIK